MARIRYICIDSDVRVCQTWKCLRWRFLWSPQDSCSPPLLQQVLLTAMTNKQPYRFQMNYFVSIQLTHRFNADLSIVRGFCAQFFSVRSFLKWKPKFNTQNFHLTIEDETITCFGSESHFALVTAMEATSLTFGCAADLAGRISDCTTANFHFKFFKPDLCQRCNLWSRS